MTSETFAVEGDESALRRWRERALAFMRSGIRSGKEVIEANAAILDLDRSDNNARTRLGFAYRVEGDFDSADAVYRQILESEPPGSTNHTTATRALTLVEAERSGAPGAVGLERQLASVINGDDAYQRGSALRDAGKLDLALRWVNRGLELANKQGRAKKRRGLAVRASIWRAKGDPASGLQDARASVALGLGYEDNSSAFVVLTACLVDLSRIDEALAVVEAHLEADVDNAYAMNAAGRALLARSDQTGEVDFLDRGERCFRRAAELTPNRPARDQLAKLAERYRKIGLEERAADLEAFLEQLKK